MNTNSIIKSRQNRFIGIDLHTNRFNTCTSDRVSQERIEGQFGLAPEELADFTNSLDKNDYLMLESCANAFAFADYFKPFVKEVIVADSHKLKIISQTNKKTDKVDARKISQLLKIQVTSGEKFINPVYIPEKEIQQLRSLFTTYEQFRKSIRSVKNHIHSLFKQNMIILPKGTMGKHLINYIKSLDLELILKFQVNIQIEELESLERKKDLIKDQIKLPGSKYYQQVDILTSIKGISVLTALALIADIGDINRFPNAKHLCSYLRSAPSVESSNMVTKIKKTNKFSRKLSISFLTQEINHFKASNTKLNNWYEAKSKNTKKGKVRMATCRKMIVHIFHMLRNEEYHYFRDELNHNKKILEYNNFLQKSLTPS